MLSNIITATGVVDTSKVKSMVSTIDFTLDVWCISIHHTSKVKSMVLTERLKKVCCAKS